MLRILLVVITVGILLDLIPLDSRTAVVEAVPLPKRGKSGRYRDRFYDCFECHPLQDISSSMESSLSPTHSHQDLSQVEQSEEPIEQLESHKPEQNQQENNVQEEIEEIAPSIMSDSEYHDCREEMSSDECLTPLMGSSPRPHHHQRTPSSSSHLPSIVENVEDVIIVADEPSMTGLVRTASLKSHPLLSLRSEDSLSLSDPSSINNNDNENDEDGEEVEQPSLSLSRLNSISSGGVNDDEDGSPNYDIPESPFASLSFPVGTSTPHEDSLFFTPSHGDPQAESEVERSGSPIIVPNSGDAFDMPSMGSDEMFMPRSPHSSHSDRSSIETVSTVSGDSYYDLLDPSGSGDNNNRPANEDAGMSHESFINSQFADLDIRRVLDGSSSTDSTVRASNAILDILSGRSQLPSPSVSTPKFHAPVSILRKHSVDLSTTTTNGGPKKHVSFRDEPIYILPSDDREPSSSSSASTDDVRDKPSRRRRHRRRTSKRSQEEPTENPTVDEQPMISGLSFTSPPSTIPMSTLSTFQREENANVELSRSLPINIHEYAHHNRRQQQQPRHLSHALQSATVHFPPQSNEQLTRSNDGDIEQEIELDDGLLTSERPSSTSRRIRNRHVFDETPFTSYSQFPTGRRSHQSNLNNDGDEDRRTVDNESEDDEQWSTQNTIENERDVRTSERTERTTTRDPPIQLKSGLLSLYERQNRLSNTHHTHPSDDRNRDINTESVGRNRRPWTPFDAPLYLQESGISPFAPFPPSSRSTSHSQTGTSRRSTPHSPRSTSRTSNEFNQINEMVVREDVREDTGTDTRERRLSSTF